MLEPGDDEFDEILDLAERTLGPGLTPPLRNRWRELVTQLLGKLSEAEVERRSSLRAKASLQIRLLAPVDRAGLFTTTLSAGGLSLRMADPPPKGTRISLAIDTQLRTEPITTGAEIVWTRAGRDGAIGALFVDLLAPDRELIEGIAITHLLAALLT